MSRREFPAKVKAQAMLDTKGHCVSCTAPLRTGHIHYDHIIPDAMGGLPTRGNCAVLCTACHRQKTSESDVPAIAKSNRVRRAHWGIRKRSSFATNRDGPFKKKISGEIVRR
jgi:5-methylcytosine-specific restriction protein A